MPNDARGRGRELRLNSPTRPTSRNVPRLLATLAGWITAITDPHRHCRQQHAATLTHVSDRDHLRGWIRGVDAAYAELDTWLRQRAAGYRQDARHLDAKSRPTAWQIAVAHELEQAAVDLDPSVAARKRDPSMRPVVAGAARVEDGS